LPYNLHLRALQYCLNILQNVLKTENQLRFSLWQPEQWLAHSNLYDGFLSLQTNKLYSVRNKEIVRFTSGDIDKMQHHKSQSIKTIKLSNQSAVCCAHIHLLNNGALVHDVTADLIIQTAFVFLHVLQRRTCS